VPRRDSSRRRALFRVRTSLHFTTISTHDLPSPPIATHLSGRHSSISHVASSRQCATSLLRPPSKLTSGEAFLWLDRQLDTMRHGPMYLRQPAIAQIVVDSIHKGAELGHYELSTLCSDGQSCPPAYSSLDQPRSPPEIAQGRERATCQSFVRANRRAILAERILRSLGAKPSRVREDSSIHRKQSGQGRTVRKPQDFPWSSAGVETSLDAARTSACATLTLSFS